MSGSLLRFSLLLLFNLSIVFLHSVCKTKEETLKDLNSITKGTINKRTNTFSSERKTKKQAIVSLSTWFHKRRIKKKQILRLKAITTLGVVAISYKQKIDNSIFLQDYSTNNIRKYKEKLSKGLLNNTCKLESFYQIPFFTNCNNNTKSENVKCFNEKNIAHTQKHFRYPHETLLNKIEINV